MNPQIIVGAYAAAPATLDHAAQFYAHLRGEPLIAGLEVPCGVNGALSAPGGESWLADQRSSRWTFTITALPATMATLAERPDVGLASPVESGRAEALRLLARVRATVDRLATVHDIDVPAVFVHSAPRAQGCSTALQRSLRELSSWDWSTTKIVLEHCDALRDGQPAAKGFLDLTAEIDVLLSNRPFAVALVNWGRSAIETRSVAGPLRHVSDCRAADLLYGVMFSGASARDSTFGPAWADAHLPVGPGHGSLMTAAEIQKTIEAAGSNVVYGVKVAAPPSASLSTRFAVVTRTLHAVSRHAGAAPTDLAEPLD
jgi:hypothetical protein